MTPAQKLVLVAGWVWTGFIMIQFMLKGYSTGPGEPWGADPTFFGMVWAIPLLLVWWPTGVLKHVTAWFSTNK